MSGVSAVQSLMRAVLYPYDFKQVRTSTASGRGLILREV